MAKQLHLFEKVREILPSPIKRQVVRVEVQVFTGEAAAIDPLGEEYLLKLWETLVQRYFPHRLDILEYSVVWSTKRQKRTLASCNLTKKRVIVAQELRAPHHAHWLDPLLYHEMCHAVLGEQIGRDRRGRRWHGPRFKRLEERHPGIQLLDAWIRAGGWATAVRSHRAKESHQKRQLVKR